MNEAKMRSHLVETYKEFYFQELDQKEKLNGRLPILIGIYSILLGVIGAFLSDVPDGDGIIKTWFYILLAAQLAMLIISVGFAILFVQCDNREVIYVMTADPLSSAPLDLYQRIETSLRLGYKEFRRTNPKQKGREDRSRDTDPALIAAQGINTYMGLWTAYNAQVPSERQRDLDEVLTLLLCEQFGRAATNQFRLNRDKRVYFRHSFRFLVVTLILGSLCGGGYFYMKLNASAKVYQVEIVNGKVDSMAKSPNTAIRSGSSRQQGRPDSSRSYPQEPIRPGALILRDSETVSRSIQRIEEKARERRDSNR